ncbi:MAG TPA: hypothetical protein VMS64_06380 [Candidatus Methylomirabilis sp.]|nr:hypothetical protein [Candidatus Methylomirabilis sp.]
MRRAIVLTYLGLTTFLVGVTDYYGDLSSRYRFVDDVQTHIFWTYRFRDPELFPQDIYADYYSSMMAPAGFRALYFIAAQGIDPLLFSKLVPFALLAVMVGYAWRLGRALEPRWGGVIAALLILDYSGNCRGGMPRSFFLSLLVPHVYYLATRRFASASAVLALEGLFEPIVFCLGFGLQGVSLVRDLVSEQAGSLSARLRARGYQLGLFLGATALAGSIVAATHILYRPAFVGPAFSRAEAAQMSEFQPGGREPFFDPDPVRFYVRSDSSGIGLHPRLARLLLAVAVLLAIVGRRFFLTPPIIVDMVVVSLLLFAISHLVFPRLYFPNRYVRYTLPLAAILTIAFHVRAAVGRVQQLVPERLQPRGHHARWATALAASGLLLVVLAEAARTVAGSPPRANPVAADLYEFLATLPKASVIAGTADRLDAVPLLAQRKIFWHPEFHAPFFKGYYRLVQERRAALVALEARAYAEIDRFCGDFGVTHFVFDRTRPLPPVVPARARLFENAGFLVTTCALGR